MNEFRIKDIEKHYGQAKKNGSQGFSLKPIRLLIQEGEFFSLLGPSGCGKTTLLKLMAGLLQADEGEIWLGEINLTKVAPEARKFAMVFQQPLLFPHMTVENNVAFGLKMQKTGKKERLERSQKMLEHVGLAGYGSRFPSELSGGQQQRVALARALVSNPRVLLMDEPFSALDPSLREEMRELLSRIQKEFQVTVVFVTHDREEAFYLSDRIGVMSEGELLQVGSAKELYEQPCSTKVASFLGIRNIIQGVIDGGRFSSAEAKLSISADSSLSGSSYMIVRPESLQLVTKNTDELRNDQLYISGIVQQLRFNHGFYLMMIQVGSLLIECVVSSQQAEGIVIGQEVKVAASHKDFVFAKK